MDISNNLSLSQIMKEFGFKTGTAIDARFNAMDTDRQAKLDEAISTLAGQDTAVMGIIEQLQRITDADPGTTAYDEGTNLYTLMQTNYVALDDRLTANESLTTSLQTWKNSFVTDYNATIARIDLDIANNLASQQAESQRLEALIQTNNDAVVAANAARATLQSALEATDASQTDEINALKTRIAAAEGQVSSHGVTIVELQTQMNTRITEIASLQTQHNDLTARVVILESKIDMASTDGAVDEFVAGLSGQTSPGGYAAHGA